MEILSKPTLVTIFFLVVFTSSCSADHDDFLQCLYSQNNTISNVIYTSNNSSYLSILQFPIKNLRFTSPSTPRPLLIVTPVHESQIQAVVYCAKKNGIQIRTRSGGHDYEGVSHTSPVPFVIIDLINLREITIDPEAQTAWVQTGAQLGELYYAISRVSRTLAFPAGVCPTVGIGGYISGGGYGTLLRKYGIAADNVIDARLIDANGRILDRNAMGEDVFWAIRGGGGGSFGIITSWKVQLVPVPETVTVFSVNRTLEQNMSQIFHRWQYIAPNLPQDIFILTIIRKVNIDYIQTVQASFMSLFLGGVDELVSMMEENFPEMGLRREDCSEVSWIQSTLFFAGFSSNEPTEVLTSRIPLTELYFKAKSDYVQEPIPEHVLQGLWKFFDEDEGDLGMLSLSSYGGRNSEISDSALPFPHRAGNLFIFMQTVYWNATGEETPEKFVDWIRRMHDYLTPYVSKSPRATYVNYRDLDIGVNNEEGYTSYEQAKVWGYQYFKHNFKRLVQVKTMIDPDNFFRHEQSIPSAYTWSM